MVLCLPQPVTVKAIPLVVDIFSRRRRFSIAASSWSKLLSAEYVMHGTPTDSSITSVRRPSRDTRQNSTGPVKLESDSQHFESSNHSAGQMSTKSSPDQMKTSVQALVALFSPLVGGFQKFTWDRSDREQGWEWTRRSAVVRQHESMRAIIWPRPIAAISECRF